MTTATRRPFADTGRLRMMRAVVGASNPFIKRVLASPYAGPLAQNVLLLRFRGRRTGAMYTTPVGYARDGDRIVIVTSPTYCWWRNVVGGADVEGRVDGRVAARSRAAARPSR